MFKILRTKQGSSSTRGDVVGQMHEDLAWTVIEALNNRPDGYVYWGEPA